jgi:diadenosine tetraphosphate (Ap4A) HIT family hydrolase
VAEWVFCRIIAGTLPASVVHRDDDVVAFMDIAPVRPGHLLVASAVHVESLVMHGHLHAVPRRAGDGRGFTWRATQPQRAERDRPAGVIRDGVA